MGDRSAIEWTDATWTPIRARNRETGRVGHFCIHKSPGCANCYAERMQPRFGNPVRFAAQDADKVELFLDEKTLPQPLRWRKPRTIFVCSMTDLFLESVPDEWIDRVFGVMAMARQHRFQVLTKRAHRMRRYMSDQNLCDRLERLIGVRFDGRLVSSPWAHSKEERWPIRNIWLGVSAEDQERAAERIPVLLDTPAAIRFVSAEPLLGPINLRRLSIGTDRELYVDALTGCHTGYAKDGPLPGRRAGLDWVIVGSESGPKARPCNLDWVRSIRDQRALLGIPLFWKQHAQNGKKIATPALDGKRWTEQAIEHEGE